MTNEDGLILSVYTYRPIYCTSSETARDAGSLCVFVARNHSKANPVVPALACSAEELSPGYDIVKQWQFSTRLVPDKHAILPCTTRKKKNLSHSQMVRPRTVFLSVRRNWNTHLQVTLNISPSAYRLLPKCEAAFLTRQSPQIMSNAVGH